MAPLFDVVVLEVLLLDNSFYLRGTSEHASLATLAWSSCQLSLSSELFQKHRCNRLASAFCTANGVFSCHHVVHLSGCTFPSIFMCNSM